MSADPVYIRGVGLHPFGRFPDQSVTELGLHAVRAAIADAEQGGDPAGSRTPGKTLDAAFCASVYSGVAAGHKVLSRIGFTGPPIMNIEAGCASGGAALSLGADLIRSGRYHNVLVFGMEKMPRGMIRSSFFPPWCEQAGLTPAPAYFALRAQRLIQQSGVTPEDLADVVVHNRRKGVENPFAMFRKEVSREEVLSSRTVCDPLHLWMLCSPNEGAAAVLLSNEPTSAHAPVELAASVLRSHQPGSALGEHTPLSGLIGEDPESPTTTAARDALAQGKLGLRDIDLVELQDTDAGRQILSIEELGLCAPGDGGAYVRAEHQKSRQTVAINPSGGLLSKGEPLGASALAQVVELVWQLRASAGARQVLGAKVGLAHTVGRGANASVSILVRH